jgi:hypothetical protein
VTGGRLPIGIIGGYGSTGKVVAANLSPSLPVLIAGRSLAGAESLASDLGSYASPIQLDILDSKTLDDFCGRCSMVINCAGPVTVLRDRVAQSAFRARCHYIDPAGMSIVKEALVPHNREIAEAGLSFIISAGWMPGLTEVLPAYTAAKARTEFGSIDSVRVYFGDSGEWSENALQDAVAFIRENGLTSALWFRKGQAMRPKASEAFRSCEMGRCALYTGPEIAELANQLKDADVFVYNSFASNRSMLDAALIYLVPLPHSARINLMRGIFRRNKFPASGFAIAEVISVKHVLRSRIVYQDRRDYWIHGTVLANVARMVSENRTVNSGVHYLADAVDPQVLMNDLCQAGIDLKEERASADERL